MIKVNKDYNNIPASLIPAFPDLFPERIGKNLVPIYPQAKTTHAKRMDTINVNEYTDNDNFNSRYKLQDIRIALQNIYRGKCAFCEQTEEVTHVEHYRPKAKYYWLAYSWDNLLISCPSCNFHKGTHFDLTGTEVVFQNSLINLRSINTLSSTYDLTEKPKMINPEVTDPSGHIHFSQDGNIHSEDLRFKYTIEKCKIDRKPLNDIRRKILDRFRKHIRDAFISNDTVDDQFKAIRTNIRNFISDSQDEKESFVAFRRYAIENDWLNEIVKGLN